MLLWMNILIIIVVLLAAGLAVWRLLRSRDKGIHAKMISASDIGEVYRQISTQSVETSFAVFVIAPPQWSTEDTLEVQFSVEEGGNRAGLDFDVRTQPAGKTTGDPVCVVQWRRMAGMRDEQMGLPAHRKR